MAFSDLWRNTPDTTPDYDPQDIQQNKTMAILAYIGPLVLIPIFAARNSRFARYHANQGLILLIAEAIYSTIYGILSRILLSISFLLYLPFSILGLVNAVFVLFAVLGIINAAKGYAKQLPFLGKYQILK